MGSCAASSALLLAAAGLLALDGPPGPPPVAAPAVVCAVPTITGPVLLLRYPPDSPAGRDAATNPACTPPPDDRGR